MRISVCSFTGLFLLLMVFAHSPSALPHVGTPPQPVKSKVTNSIGIPMVLVHHGEFEMGSEETLSEEPMHHVTLTKDFYLAAEPVTIAQFQKFVKATGFKTETDSDGKGCEGIDPDTNWFATKPELGWHNPGFAQGSDHPVVCVSWNDAIAFCEWLSKKEGKHYRLPTEAEMEYSQRAGTITRFPNGNAPEGLKKIGNIADQALVAKLGQHIVTMNQAPKGYESGVGDWNDGYPFTAPVGKFEPNPWGLYDMNGNVWTWCSDWEAKKYQAGPQVDPIGAPAPSPNDVSSHRGRCARGGAWDVGPWRCRSNARMQREPERSFSYIGIRVAREPE